MQQAPSRKCAYKKVHSAFPHPNNKHASVFDLDLEMNFYSVVNLSAKGTA